MRGHGGGGNTGSQCRPLVVGVCAAYSQADADVCSQSLLEANVTTEVCLTVLDTLSTFIKGFKVTPLSRSLSADSAWECIYCKHV